jgi:hypothetical protein
MWAMVATSNHATVRRLGPRSRQLHTLGIYWLWFVFAFSYAGRVAEGRWMFVPFLAAARSAHGASLRRALAHQRGTASLARTSNHSTLVDGTWG